MLNFILRQKRVFYSAEGHTSRRWSPNSTGDWLDVGNINGTIISILQFNGTLSSWWTRIGVGLLTLIFIGIQSLFYMRKKHS